ncbi:MAG: bacteriohopanetetrol glucosamine biosynthesis glycosyltransferase HpnI [Terriglobales bacterium]
MIHHIAKLIESIAIIGTISGIAYNLLCLSSAASFLQQSKSAGKSARAAQHCPPVSVLKPLKGTDPQMYENLHTHCLQNYPDYEIVFGVNDRNDPAVAVVERLMLDFPKQPMRLILCKPNMGANVKAGNLAQMAAQARSEYLVVSDSDIKVSPHHLRRVVAPLHDGKIGLVTCLYRGVAAADLGSRLESVGISTDFAPGVLAARTVENGIRFGLGSTLAFRRGDLATIGGFESFADYLADDYELGSRIAELGLRVVLSEEVVETVLPHYSLVAFMQHQLRWARTVRDSRYWGFAGLIFTFALPWALLAVLFSAAGSPVTWRLLGLVLFLRLAVAVVVGRLLLEDKHILRLAWLIPLRDLLAPFVWAAALVGNTVAWRGERFRLKQGKLTRL